MRDVSCARFAFKAQLGKTDAGNAGWDSGLSLYTWREDQAWRCRGLNLPLRRLRQYSRELAFTILASRYGESRAVCLAVNYSAVWGKK